MHENMLQIDEVCEARPQPPTNVERVGSTQMSLNAVSTVTSLET